MAEKGRGGAHNPGSSRKKDTAGKAKIDERRKIDDSDYYVYAQFKVPRSNPRIPCSSEGVKEELFTVELTAADVDKMLNLTQLQADMLMDEYSRPVLDSLITFAMGIDLFDEHDQKYPMILGKQPNPVGGAFHYLCLGWFIVGKKRKLKAGDVVKFYKLASVGRTFVKGRASFFININKPDAEEAR
ncbi:hypothetical protein ABFX02_14G054400 [Erythranthe guttata]